MRNSRYIDLCYFIDSVKLSTSPPHPLVWTVYSCDQHLVSFSTLAYQPPSPHSYQGLWAPSLCTQFDQLNGWQTISTYDNSPSPSTTISGSCCFCSCHLSFLLQQLCDFRLSKVSFHTEAPVPWSRSHNWHNWPLVLIIADSGTPPLLGYTIPLTLSLVLIWFMLYETSVHMFVCTPVTGLKTPALLNLGGATCLTVMALLSDMPATCLLYICSLHKK